MTNRFSLQTLVDLAKDNADTAIRKLGELNRENQDIAARLELLIQYRQEYQTRFEESTRAGMNQMEWMNYRNFLNKIDEAILKQEEILSNFKVKIEAGQADFQQQQKKLKSFETLATRHDAIEAAKAMRREQKELDEYSNKIFMEKRKEERSD